MRSKKIAGALGLACAAVFTAAAVVSALMFENGAYSPKNCFVTELGRYAGAFLAASPALVFNAGLMLSGILFGVFMVMNGLRREALLNTAASFFGVLSGILMAAGGLFSLNFYTYHYILASAFFVSLFIMCALHLVSRMLAKDRWSAPAQTIAAFLTGAAAALSAVYMITGGMAQVFAEDALGIGRANVIPFAIIGWAAYTLLLVFTAILSVRMLAEKEEADSSAGSGNGKKQAALKRSAKTPGHSYR